jgi:hypothetical protein
MSTSPTSAACLVETPPRHGLWLGVLGPTNWVGALSAYNDGSLHGGWLDLERVEGERAWRQACDHLIATSPEPREARIRVLDATGLGRRLGQDPAAADVVELGRAARDLSGELLPAFEAWIERTDWTPHHHGAGEALERFRRCFLGLFPSLESWAHRRLEESGLLAPVPRELRPFLDAVAWAHADVGGEVVEVGLAEQEVAIFRFERSQQIAGASGSS